MQGESTLEGVRKYLGLTVSQAAAILDMEPARLRIIEAGAATPTAFETARFLQVYRIPRFLPASPPKPGASRV